MLKRTIIMLSILGISQNLYADDKPFLEYGTYDCVHASHIITDVNGEQTTFPSLGLYSVRVTYTKDKISEVEYITETKALTKNKREDAKFLTTIPGGDRMYSRGGYRKARVMFQKTDGKIIYSATTAKEKETLDRGNKITYDIQMYFCHKSR